MLPNLFSVSGESRVALRAEPGVAKDGRLEGCRKDVTAIMLDTSRIRKDASQVRKSGKEATDPAVQELAGSIEKHGLIQAIEVRYIEDDNIYQIVAGEGRFVACTETLDWSEIPARIVDIEDEAQLRWRQIHENLHRRALKAFEIADSVQAALDSGMSRADVARELGKDRSFVDRCLGVKKKLSVKARDALIGSPQGDSLSTVYAVSTLKLADQLPVTEEIVRQKMTTRQAEEHVAAAKMGTTKTKRRGRAKPFERVFKLDQGISIVVKARRSDVSDDEIVEAARTFVERVKDKERLVLRAG